MPTYFLFFLLVIKSAEYDCLLPKLCSSCRLMGWVCGGERLQCVNQCGGFTVQGRVRSFSLGGTSVKWETYVSLSFLICITSTLTSTGFLYLQIPSSPMFSASCLQLYKAKIWLPLGQVISKFSNISYRCYADDIKLYVSFKPDNPDSLSVLHNCLNAIKDWMSHNFWQLQRV